MRARFAAPAASIASASSVLRTLSGRIVVSASLVRLPSLLALISLSLTRPVARLASGAAGL